MQEDNVVGVDLSDEQPAIVEAMVGFFYTFDYESKGRVYNSLQFCPTYYGFVACSL